MGGILFQGMTLIVMGRVSIALFLFKNNARVKKSQNDLRPR